MFQYVLLGIVVAFGMFFLTRMTIPEESFMTQSMADKANRLLDMIEFDVRGDDDVVMKILAPGGLRAEDGISTNKTITITQDSAKWTIAGKLGTLSLNDNFLLKYDPDEKAYK